MYITVVHKYTSIFNILGDHIKQFFSTFTNIKIMFV